MDSDTVSRVRCRSLVDFGWISQSHSLVLLILCSPLSLTSIHIYSYQLGLQRFSIDWYGGSVGMAARFPD